MASDHSEIHVINSVPEFLQKVQDIRKYVVVFFTRSQTTSEADACRLMSPIFNELSQKYKNLIFLQVELPNLTSIGTLYQVKEVPSFAFLKPTDSDEKLSGCVSEFIPPLVGADKEELERRCMNYDTTA